ncbi:MAG: YggS family pyridoxal phosphate-dependent enzyme [Thermoflavifilum aggregans]|mgnify:CR=1 FL=1|nr:YggS family pyridoxal phosphate-dependent enzyme [Thermoflavifilum aggregans]
MTSVDFSAYQQLLQELQPRNVKLIAVSKTFPPEAILALYEKGHRDFGENYVQELVSKQKVLPPDIRWHFIGHLQTNKVKHIAPFIHCIQSVDSIRVLQEIDRQAEKYQRIIPVMLQVHIAKETTKFGLDEASLHELLKQHQAWPHARIIGLMGMATFTDNTQVIQSEFHYLKLLFDQLKQTYFSDNPNFSELSMGMSHDYRIAVQEGSTMVRIGSLIFGERKKY